MVLGVKIATQALLNEVNNGLKRNIVCSPMSISATMNLLASGSKGPELSEWLGLLGAKSVAEIDAKSQKLIRAAKPSRNQGPMLYFVNGVWMDKKLPLQPHLYQELEPFVHKAKTVYKAPVKFLDIEGQPDEAVQEINKWAAAASRGHIKSIVSKENLKPKQLLIANALYFKGFWQNQFDSRLTQDDKFFLHNKQVVQVPFMTKTRLCCDYKSFNDFKVLRLPYKNDEFDPYNRRFSIYFFLPHKAKDLPSLLQRVSSNPEILYDDLKLQNVTANVEIPKFKFSYELDLKDVMEKELGLSLPINLVSEEEIANSEDVDGLFKVSIGHLSTIEVNEKGTEASAVTRSRFMGGASRVQPINFIGDHPFVFVLKEETSRVVFFIGAVINPLIH